MTIETFPDNVPDPDFGSSNSVSFDINENTFGDGYAQRSAAGINNVRDTWTASWSHVRTAEKDIIIDFIKARGGWEAFKWTAPGDIERMWTARDPQFNPVDAGYWSIKVNMRQEFDPI